MFLGADRVPRRSSLRLGPGLKMTVETTWVVDGESGVPRSLV